MVKKQGSKVWHLFKKVDLFPTDVNFRENGGSSFKSGCGACISVFIFVIMVFYSTSKLSILVNYEDTNYSDILEENGLEERFYSAEEMNFFVAFEIVSLGGRQIEDIDIERYINFEALVIAPV